MRPFKSSSAHCGSSSTCCSSTARRHCRLFLSFCQKIWMCGGERSTCFARSLRRKDRGTRMSRNEFRRSRPCSDWAKGRRELSSRLLRIEAQNGRRAGPERERKRMASAKDAKSARKDKAGGIVTPADLDKMEQERESAAAREALEKMRHAEQDQRSLHEALMAFSRGVRSIKAREATIFYRLSRGVFVLGVLLLALLGCKFRPGPKFSTCEFMEWASPRGRISTCFVWASPAGKILKCFV